MGGAPFVSARRPNMAETPCFRGSLSVGQNRLGRKSMKSAVFVLEASLCCLRARPVNYEPSLHTRARLVCQIAGHGGHGMTLRPGGQADFGVGFSTRPSSGERRS